LLLLRGFVTESPIAWVKILMRYRSLYGEHYQW